MTRVTDPLAEQQQGELNAMRLNLAQSQMDLTAANEVAEHLREALGTSRLIGMAIGILMERHRVTADDAFALLTAASQRENRKLRVLADRLVLTGSLDNVES